MFELQYYTNTGYVKTIELTLNKKEDGFECSPVEPYFIKGLTIKDNFLDENKEFDILREVINPLEQHFLNINYGFYHELKPHYFRNENEKITFRSPVLFDLYKPVEMPKM